MRIFMLGWEFPPYISGGLGTACLGITQGLAALNQEVIFVLPSIRGEKEYSHLELVSAVEALGLPGREISREELHQADRAMLEIRPLPSPLRPYLTSEQYAGILYATESGDYGQYGEPWGAATGGLLAPAGEYSENLIEEVIRYGILVEEIARTRSFDLIHAHDWMTVYAGIRARAVSGKPLVLHIHSLEYDRSGENINPAIYNIELHGLQEADHVIAVSHYTKNRIIHYYGIPGEKITVVHNAVSHRQAPRAYRASKVTDQKIVLFLGRITLQKGPDYFVEAAAKVLKILPDVMFIMAGTGDMMPRMIERVAQLGIGKNFHFTGFLRGEEVEKVFAISDLYVMPSVSEPFGISPLESMLYDVPVIISHQSGVSELIKHALKVNFWDVDDIAEKIIAVLKYPVLPGELTGAARGELEKIHWTISAEKITKVYERLLKET